MSNSEAKGLFGLVGEQYWHGPLWQKSASDFSTGLLQSEADGIFIDAPPKVYLDEHETVPLAAFRAGAKSKLSEHSFETTTHLILSHMETGRTQITKAAAYPDFTNPPASPGWAVLEIEVDIAAIFNLDPGLGKYSTWMVCGPESSNKLEFQLYPSRKSELNPEVLLRLENMRKEGALSLPHFEGKTWHNIESPVNKKEFPLPHWKLAKGKSAASPNQINLEYRIEGLPRFLFQKEKPHLDKSGKRVYANIPVLLIGFDENRSLFIQENLGLPVMSAPEGTGSKPILSGHATFDVGLMVEGKKPLKSLTLWAISMDQRSMVELEIGAGKAE